MTTRRRVLIADDHPIVREGLRSLMEKAGHQIVAEATNGREAVEQAKQQPVDVALLDLIMPEMNGLDAARELAQATPNTRSILLTLYADRPYVIEALQAGAKGYVLKTQASDDLLHAVDEVCRGAIYISPGVNISRVEAALEKDEPGANVLTARERQILILVAESKSTKEIARILDISYKTAESHRSRLMKKLGIHETAGLVRYAVRRGLVQA